MGTPRWIGRAAAVAAGGAALGWLGHAAVTWARYGRANRRLPPDDLLDPVMPDYEVRERHEVRVDAPAEAVFAAARALDLRRSRLVQAIFTGRELLMRSRHVASEQARPFLEAVQALGWRVLLEQPGRAIVLGAVTQPWQADVRFRGLPLEELAAFREPGYAKIVWSFEVERLGPDAALFRTETRVATTDAASRARFRRYWAVTSPGIRLIRRETLRLVRRAAESWRAPEALLPSTVA